MGEKDKAVKMIQLNIDDRDWLYKSYMRFVEGGGIYFFSDEDFSIGDEVFLVLTIKIDAINQKYPMRTEIVWENSRVGGKGYGVSFGNDDVAKNAKRDVELLLENLLDSDQKTFTM